jgi:hypothetical protein
VTFDFLKECIRGVVDFGGEFVKSGTELVSTIATEVIATPAEAILGKNVVSDHFQELNQFANELTGAGNPVSVRLFEKSGVSSSFRARMMH